MQIIKQSFTFFSLALLMLSCGGYEEATTQHNPTSASWINLTEGNTLTGWSTFGGEATYTIKDGVVTGTTVADTPNSFLTTDKKYGDFILELEYLVDPKMNSGVQFRSNSFSYYRDGLVHGYQMEIDPSPRAFSGGIYDEKRRKWLVSLKDNPAGQKAFKQGEWNKARVEAVGDSLRIWLNGVPTAHLVDDKTASGFIGLQVHSIYNEMTPGMEIKWRNIRILTEDLASHVRKSDLPAVTTLNQLTQDEAKNGWKLLFDGKFTSQWRGAKLKTFPTESWTVTNGILSVADTGGEESAAGGDIVTIEQYGDFELTVDFRLTEGANSGIKYYVDTELNKGEGSSIGLEYQLLDDATHPDAKLGSHEGSRTLASVYDLVQADPAKPAGPIGSWNTAYIKSKAGKVEYYLNDAKVLEFDRFSDEFKQLIKDSKYAKWKGFGQFPSGHILLQDHGDRVDFRNIKIRKL